MKRGDVVIGRERGAYTGKPRPWLVVQGSTFLDEPFSVTVCAISSTAALTSFRVPLRPSAENGLREACSVLADKTATLKIGAIENVVGVLDDPTMMRVDDALRLWLDL